MMQSKNTSFCFMIKFKMLFETYEQKMYHNVV